MPASVPASAGAPASEPASRELGDEPQAASRKKSPTRRTTRGLGIRHPHGRRPRRGRCTSTRHSQARWSIQGSRVSRPGRRKAGRGHSQCPSMGLLRPPDTSPCVPHRRSRTGARRSGRFRHPRSPTLVHVTSRTRRRPWRAGRPRGLATSSLQESGPYAARRRAVSAVSTPGRKEGAERARAYRIVISPVSVGV